MLRPEQNPLPHISAFTEQRIWDIADKPTRRQMIAV